MKYFVKFQFHWSQWASLRCLPFLDEHPLKGTPCFSEDVTKGNAEKRYETSPSSSPNLWLIHSHWGFWAVDCHGDWVMPPLGSVLAFCVRLRKWDSWLTLSIRHPFEGNAHLTSIFIFLPRGCYSNCGSNKASFFFLCSHFSYAIIMWEVLARRIPFEGNLRFRCCFYWWNAV